MRKVISNTTPLIGLSEIGCLNLLKKLYGEILIPTAVLSEIKSEPSKSLVKNSDFIRVLSISDTNADKIFSSKLHAGEKEVILLAEKLKADLLLMDDNAAKKTAKFMGMKVTGTLGILLKAKQNGYISEIKPFLIRLTDTGFFVSEKIYQFVLEEANE